VITNAEQIDLTVRDDDKWAIVQIIQRRQACPQHNCVRPCYQL